jgi:hypothetical protein
LDLSLDHLAHYYNTTGRLLSGYRIEVGMYKDGVWKEDFAAEIDSPFGSFVSQFFKPEIMKSCNLKQFFE